MIKRNNKGSGLEVNWKWNCFWIERKAQSPLMHKKSKEKFSFATFFLTFGDFFRLFLTFATFFPTFATFGDFYEVYKFYEFFLRQISANIFKRKEPEVNKKRKSRQIIRKNWNQSKNSIRILILFRKILIRKSFQPIKAQLKNDKKSWEKSSVKNQNLKSLKVFLIFHSPNLKNLQEIFANFHETFVIFREILWFFV